MGICGSLMLIVLIVPVLYISIMCRLTRLYVKKQLHIILSGFFWKAWKIFYQSEISQDKQKKAFHMSLGLISYLERRINNSNLVASWKIPQAVLMTYKTCIIETPCPSFSQLLKRESSFLNNGLLFHNYWSSESNIFLFDVLKTHIITLLSIVRSLFLL